ncbi:sugar ABC transporter permease [Paenibacillus sp. N3.4]|uniref:carbohydrate ABC transporter permease n=1 Tax=Paenibacillus sp. N3.4 TaxID=2603222 RepID=UPI0028FC7EBD|nr:sugar ABC transporter permease [Paenibacillus sp. N3.4]
MINKLSDFNKKEWVGLLYITPWIIGFALFQLYPLVTSLGYSFTDYTMRKSPNFIGFDNYVHMFMKDDDFFQSLKITFLYVLMAVPFKLGFALLIAVLVNVKLKYVNLFRTLYYLPSILGGSVAVSILWRFLFMKEGMVNEALASLSIPQSIG